MGVCVILLTGGVINIKYYRSAENGWGIVFSAKPSLPLYKGLWGVGGVRKYAVLGAE